MWWVRSTSKRLLAGRNPRVGHIVRVSVNLRHVLAEYVEYKEVHRVGYAIGVALEMAEALHVSYLSIRTQHMHCTLFILTAPVALLLHLLHKYDGG